MVPQKSARLVPQPDGTQPEEMTHISTFVFIKKGGKVLLLRRVRPERLAGKWTVPAALLFYGEDPATAARRLVTEQVGAAASSVKLLDIQSFGDKHWDLCFVYEAEVPSVGSLGQDFDKADYFDPRGTPAETREDHQEVIAVARSRLFL